MKIIESESYKKRMKRAKEDGWPDKLKEGRFTTYCKQQGFEGPCKECADKAMKSDDPSVRGMASFYLNTTLTRKAASSKKDKKKQKEDGKPYAICTESIGSKEGTNKRSEWSDDALERYERCVKSVKKKEKEDKK